MNKAFQKYQAQTTPHPLGLEVKSAQGIYIYTTDGKAHLDFVAGVSACNLGHCHPEIVKAIKTQAEQYLHVMVYGEYVLKPALEVSKTLARLLPQPLQQTYLVNSGTEAIDGSIKLARRATGRTQIIAAKHCYHGNSYGALSLMDYQERTQAFAPLLPHITHIEFNNENCLNLITDKTAAVVLETIQGGAGFIMPENDYLKKVKQRCEKVGALLILDDIQPGFGRTGKLFGFEHFGIVPDILVMGKAMASGLPIGAFTASKQLMTLLSDKPKLGHITTFGGHPLIAAAALKTLEVLEKTDIINQISAKEQQIRTRLKHPLIQEIRGKGLMLALIMKTETLANQLVLKAKDHNLILFWLLYEKKAVRITPPLTISETEIDKGCQIILNILNNFNTQ
ncbi:aspartate aminotransferase family protein [Mesohalobacter halotolerans]|uniref:Aspartate aminotransferase family protein n=1 Tax=Mesohalobacter halotolerans TaxID=1883405 RepID=A0A4U5TNJ9_9FLAO|nr:aspartate aminotransferase family protein [Mesohalobacter halotolerans]MBS3738183.1 aspartate aminotransferase family protein [Psychroflexus sp.]TKS55550.1 aspartate aminotransferase family protein [Mesohalobacter halotolerans]